MVTVKKLTNGAILQEKCVTKYQKMIKIKNQKLNRKPINEGRNNAKVFFLFLFCKKHSCL